MDEWTFNWILMANILSRSYSSFRYRILLNNIFWIIRRIGENRWYGAVIYLADARYCVPTGCFGTFILWWTASRLSLHLDLLAVIRWPSFVGGGVATPPYNAILVPSFWDLGVGKTAWAVFAGVRDLLCLRKFLPIFVLLGNLVDYHLNLIYPNSLAHLYFPVAFLVD